MRDMTMLEEYQEFVDKGKHFSPAYSADSRMELCWASLGLTGEAGEVAGVVDKMLRKDRSVEDVEDKVFEELGDVIWYCAAVANAMGFSLDEVIMNNIAKLTMRHG